MENPWNATPLTPDYVLEVDRPYVDAWNAVRAEGREEVRLRLEVLPDPMVGPREAPLVVLGRNPGWSGSEPEDHAPPQRTSALRANLVDDPVGHVHPYLTQDFADTGGGMWWQRKCLRAVQPASGASFEELARRVLAVEFHGYHSVKWAPLPVTLPSQWYAFELVSRAVERGAVVVVLRGGKDWDVAVPSLRSYPRRFSTNTVRSASISPGNLPTGAFEQVVNAVHA